MRSSRSPRLPRPSRSSPVSSFKTRPFLPSQIRPIASIPCSESHAKIISRLQTNTSDVLFEREADMVVSNRPDLDLFSYDKPSETYPPNSSSPSGITPETYRSLFGFSPFNVDADADTGPDTGPDTDSESIMVQHFINKSFDEVQKYSRPSRDGSHFVRSLTPDQYNELYTNIVNRAIFETWNDKNQNLAMSQFLLKEYYRLIDEMVSITKSSADKDFRENIHRVYKKLISKVYNTIDFYASKI
jgi:hypothetical protein